jgi:hypothetical protein
VVTDILPLKFKLRGRRWLRHPRWLVELRSLVQEALLILSSLDLVDNRVLVSVACNSRIIA